VGSRVEVAKVTKVTAALVGDGDSDCGSDKRRQGRWGIAHRQYIPHFDLLSVILG
jgi:hypothetical protein